MIKQIKIPGIIFLSAIIIVVLCRFFDILSSLTTYSILYASLIALFNFALFVYLFNHSFKKSNKSFLIVNFGGMVLRLLLMLVSVFIILRFLEVDDFGFIFMFFLWYTLCLIFEINILRAKLEKSFKISKNVKNVD